MEHIATSLASIIIAKQAYKAAKRLARMRQERHAEGGFVRSKQLIVIFCCAAVSDV